MNLTWLVIGSGIEKLNFPCAWYLSVKMNFGKMLCSLQATRLFCCYRFSGSHAPHHSPRYECVRGRELYAEVVASSLALELRCGVSECRLGVSLLLLTQQDKN